MMTPVRATFRRASIALVVITVAVGLGGCVLVPAPGYVAGPPVVVPVPPPVVVVPAPRVYGYWGGYGYHRHWW